jgi:flagellar L-ring protein FlgH
MRTLLSLSAWLLATTLGVADAGGPARDAIVDAVRARMGADATVVVEPLDVAWTALPLAEDVVFGPGASLGGPVTVLLRASVVRGGAATLAPVARVRVRIQVTADHWHTTRAVPRGTVLAEGDVASARHVIATGAIDRLPSAADVVGAAALRDLPGDACVTARAVRPMPAVRAGDAEKRGARSARGVGGRRRRTDRRARARAASGDETDAHGACGRTRRGGGGAMRRWRKATWGRWIGLAIGIGLVGAVTLQAGGQQASPSTPPPDSQEKALERYLATARAVPASDPSGWMHGLSLDLRARKLNDILTIRVEENIAASGSADASLAKSTSSGIGITSLFGLQNKIPASVGLGDLASSQSDSGFSGSGATARAGTLTATLSARVAEVLPNGDLLLEGVREIEINGDRQIVVLTGIARVVDIGPGNVISSATLGQLRIRYFGKGLTKGSMTPGWLLRLLNKVF